MDNLFENFMLNETNLDSKKINQLSTKIPVKTLLKDSILLRQGDISTKCYFVLKGCIRQYLINDDGKEITVNFFTEKESVVLFDVYNTNKPSDYFLICLEDSTLIIGDPTKEEAIYNEFPETLELTKTLMEKDFGKSQKDLVIFKSLTPEERYIHIKKSRPDLLSRVPQNQLASYLGITPETLSRIKKRLSTSSN